MEFETKSDSSEHRHENDFSDLLEMEEVVLNSKNEDVFTCAHDKTCSEIDDWFNNRLKNTLKISLKNNQPCKNKNQELMRLNEELETANLKRPQHNVEELANQLLCLERLHACYKKKKLKNAC